MARFNTPIALHGETKTGVRVVRGLLIAAVTTALFLVGLAVSVLATT